MQLKVIEDDPDMLYFKNNCESGYTEMELRVCDLWITNQLLDPTKTFIFHELFLPKYDNFKMISTEDICLSVSLSCSPSISISLYLSLAISSYLSISISISLCSIQGVKLNNERTKFRKLCGHTVKLRSFFFHEAIFFFLNSNPAIKNSNLKQPMQGMLKRRGQ